jgi:hypothetical protein
LDEKLWIYSLCWSAERDPQAHYNSIRAAISAVAKRGKVAVVHEISNGQIIDVISGLKHRRNAVWNYKKHTSSFKPYEKISRPDEKTLMKLFAS